MAATYAASVLFSMTMLTFFPHLYQMGYELFEALSYSGVDGWGVRFCQLDNNRFPKKEFVSVRNSSNILVTVLSTTVLAACGGGSDSNGGGSTPEPLYGIGGTVTGLVNSGLALENNGGDNLQVAGVSFEFDTKLADGESYSVSFASHPDQQLCELANASGSVAGADVDDIDVQCRSWGTEALIENTSEHARFPQIALDGNGNATAVWQQSDGTYENIYANRYTPATGWGSAELVENGSSGHAYWPQIAVDSAGNAIAVWYQDDGTNYNLYANRYTASSGSWGTEELLESSNAGDVVYPSIAFDSNDNAIVVWQQSDGTYESIYANRYTPATGWGTAELIESGNNGNATQPKIVFDSADNAIAIWNQGNGSDDIFINRYTAGAGWGTEEVIAIGSFGNAVSPQIAIDSNGNAIAVWLEQDGTKVSLYANRYTASTDVWGGEELIEDSDDGHAYSPQVVIDSNDNGIVVWHQSDSGNTNSVYAKRYTPGAGWGAEELIESSISDDAEYPKIVIDGDDNVIAVWHQDNHLYANRYAADTGSWGAEALIGGGNFSVNGPQIAVGGDGNAITVWYQYDGTHLSIYANHFK
ncbi:hypothetical protein [Marinobacter zhejiangensis]|uniref:Uncharacterized protein n=1 Tax=Marinobacter zhejiangensis TaxID=488535 RepID=A0A1I4PWK2_9GAMM|nr:hypothetical protein [Marinobacter zhejiangensis]SFM32202.1 hypothetical protein SAMN04487963_2036 [Marinobacter zhejiangensis]